ncbi:MAG: M60 family metallopeptidase, partial [Bacteroidota bacterium]
VNKGFKVLVGAHSYDMSGRNNVKRFFRVTTAYPITDTITQIANPFGGGIYIITPYEADLGIREVQLTNVVPAPFFSAKGFNRTSLQEWKEEQRLHPAPWADFESDKYMMQVPTSWIYNYDDPVTLMQDWDNRMDVVSTLLGYPFVRNNTMLYLQVDCDIMYGFYGIGNPQINNTYDPLEPENGNKNHWFLRPGDGFWETEFHEMGHAQLFSKFPGETEAAVNLLAAAIYNRLYGMDIDTALGNSFGNQPQITRDQAAMNWMVTPNFRAGNPMDISNTTKDEVRYQQRGYAKYVEMAALFGWEMIDSFYRKENLDYIAQTPIDSLPEVDSRILRFSRTAGADLRPLIHFWGVQPQNAAVLKEAITAENLQASKLICDRLTHYKAILPADNAEFLAHANAFFGGSIPPGGDPDYGSGWYNIWKDQYDSTLGTLGKQAMQNIIDLYFPNGCPAPAPAPTVSVTSQSICPGQSATLVASGAMYYQWSNGETGNSITVSPAETSTFTVIGKTAGVSSLPVSAQVTVNPIPAVSVQNATICSGETAVLTASGAETFNWSNGELGNSISVSPTETTAFSVIGTSLGCAAPPVSAQVFVNALPTINLGADIVLQQGQEITLNAAAPGLIYQWSNGATTDRIVVNSMGIYAITVTNLAGCSASDSILVTIIVSTTDQNEHYKLSIEPNPTSGLVSITCAGSSTNTVQVMDNLGRIVAEDNTFLKDGATRILNIGQLPAGTYFIKIMGVGILKIVPIIKQ